MSFLSSIGDALTGGLGSAAGGLFSSLLGGSETSTSVAATPTMTSTQMAILEELLQKAKAGIKSGEVSSMPSFSIPITDAEQSFLDFVNTGVGSQLLSGEVPYETGPGWAENYFEKSIKPQAMKNYNEIVIPELKAAYAGPGYYGSARANAQTEAAQNLSDSLTSQLAELQYKEELASREAKDAALDRAANNTSLLTTAGTIERDAASEKALENLTRYLSGESVNGQQAWYYNPNVTMAMSLLGYNPYSYTTSTSTSSNSALGNALFSGLGTAVGDLISDNKSSISSGIQKLFSSMSKGG